MKISPLARRVAAVWLASQSSSRVSGDMETTMQFVLSYPDEGMTREQALRAVARRLGPVRDVRETETSRSDGQIHDVLTMVVSPALAEKHDRDGYWQARAGEVLIEAVMS